MYILLIPKNRCSWLEKKKEWTQSEAFVFGVVARTSLCGQRRKRVVPTFVSCVIARTDFPRWKKYGARAWTFVLVSPEHFFLWIERAREKPPVRLAFCPCVITRRTFMDGGGEIEG